MPWHYKDLGSPDVGIAKKKKKKIEAIFIKKVIDSAFN